MDWPLDPSIRRPIRRFVNDDASPPPSRHSRRISFVILESYIFLSALASFEHARSPSREIASSTGILKTRFLATKARPLVPANSH